VHVLRARHPCEEGDRLMPDEFKWGRGRSQHKRGRGVIPPARAIRRVKVPSVGSKPRPRASEKRDSASRNRAVRT
jgi:hypothetical protein